MLPFPLEGTQLKYFKALSPENQKKDIVALPDAIKSQRALTEAVLGDLVNWAAAATLKAQQEQQRQAEVLKAQQQEQELATLKAQLEQQQQRLSVIGSSSNRAAPANA